MKKAIAKTGTPPAAPKLARTIDSEADVADGLAYLTRKDRRLVEVASIAGAVPLRRRAHGLEGLARIVVGQQLSVASADAIWGRFAIAFPDMAAHRIVSTSDEVLRAAGLSAAKMRTLRAIAAAHLEGLDFNALATAPAAEAHARLTAIKGIGSWTADLYLLFCLGHADIFPAGDLALRNAVADAFKLTPPLSIAEVEKIAAKWAPRRGVAARLFWAYYRARRNRTGVPI